MKLFIKFLPNADTASFDVETDDSPVFNDIVDKVVTLSNLTTNDRFKIIHNSIPIRNKSATLDEFNVKVKFTFFF